MADKRLNAVWRSGAGEETWYTGLSVADFNAKNAELFNRSMRITDLDTNGGLSAVWHPGNDGQVTWINLTEHDFLAKDNELVGQGLRLQSLRASDGKIAAVWRTGSGEQHVLATSHINEIFTADGQYFPRGLRIQTVQQDSDKGRYYGVWRSDLGTGAQWLARGLTDAQFSAEDAKQNAAGLRLVQITAFDGLTGIWRTGSDTSAWTYLQPFDAFVGLENRNTAAGLRMVNLSVGFV